MPRERSESRKKAFEMWLKSNGEKPLQEIAEELGVSSAQIRSWKYADKWTKRVQIAEDKMTGKLKMKRPVGAQPGSKNALGNKGGAPKGNQNHFKHGAYARVMSDLLQGKEKEVFDDETAGEDLEAELRKTLAMLNAREIRLTTRIAELRKVYEAQSVEESLEDTSTTEYTEETGVFLNGVKVKGTGFYDGKKATTKITNRAAVFDSLNKLESELDKVYGRKIKILGQLEAIRSDRERLELERKKLEGETEQSKLANAWIAALTGEPLETDEEEEPDADSSEDH